MAPVVKDTMPSQVLNQNQWKQQFFEKTMNDLIDLVRTTGLEHPQEAQAFDRVTDFLKLTEHFNPNNERNKNWERQNHSDCCKIDAESDQYEFEYNVSRPEDNFFDRIQSKLEEYHQQIKAVPEDTKLKFFNEIHSNLTRISKLVGLMVIEHLGDSRFLEFVKQGRGILEHIEQLKKELKQKNESMVEQNVEVKQEEVEEKVENITQSRNEEGRSERVNNNSVMSVLRRIFVFIYNFFMRIMTFWM